MIVIPSPASKKKARIEIIPLIDIIFFLLATFVMVSLSMVKNKGIPVNLPVAASSAPQERDNHVALTITQQGEIYFNKEIILPEQLPARLQQLKAEVAEPRIFINGDERAFFGQAVLVLDEVRKLGFTQVAIETKAKDSAPSP